jgi:tetratricopeptide (TPR) repeat protein
MARGSLPHSEVRRRGILAVFLLFIALLLNQDLMLASLGYQTTDEFVRNDLNQARSKLFNGRASEALDQAEALHRSHPGDLRVTSFLLDANLQTGHPARTEELAERALKRNPELLGFRLRLGEAQRLLGKLPQAEMNLHTFLAQRPENLWGQYFLGRIKEDQGQVQEAEEIYRSVLAKNGNFFQVLLQLGGLLEASGRFQEARKLYRTSSRPETRERLAQLPSSPNN